MVALAGCGRNLVARGGEHGNLLAQAAAHDERDARRHARESALPLVVLVERSRVVAVDPIHARTRWTLPLSVSGHPVASAGSVYLPVRGGRLVAVERATGKVRFDTDLPGEALTGLAVSEPWIAATVVGESSRGEILGLSTLDGHVRWRRRSAEPLGIPDVVGKIAVVPIGEQVAALRLGNGRELARLDVGEGTLRRVTHRGGAWFVGDGARWVSLGSRGNGSRAHELERSYAPAFPTGDGLDVGHGDDERLRMWLRLSSVDATPRDAILLSRRAVIAMRLDREGRPIRARWVHVETKGELVAMEVTGDRVVLVREDGAIVQLADDDGRVLDRIAGDEPVRGALIIGAPARSAGDAARSDDPAVVDRLLELIDDPDPRLLPAQRLAADLLWRGDDAKVRGRVNALADGKLRSEDTPAAAVLREHARGLTGEAWGSGTSVDVDALLVALRSRPRFGEDDAAARTDAIRGAVRSGSPAVVRELSELLMHPGTRSEDLVEIVRALAELKDPGAVEAVATFVRRYHADQLVAYESSALVSAAALLFVHAKQRGPARAPARAALEDAADDPLCEPSLRAFIAHGLDELPPAEVAQNEPAHDDDEPPVLSADL
ncbi:MAG TPA: PQQ-binding-like beta-propeller repeat protein [Nannocystaceae bacterium]|nr:PQQ-binding-like beta-propeller repeat protein [Nannocystaceae bacterium]